jgi:predicted NUDIX family NTP pyrophosphohydrolase
VAVKLLYRITQIIEFMPKKSAGLLLYRFNKEVEFFLVHPGGPFWNKKDAGAWSIPKGEFGDEENALEAAVREFKEETGFDVTGTFIPLTPFKQSNGKMIYAFALHHNLDETQLKCNTFSMEWPPKSGKQQEFPEVDRGAWFNTEISKIKLLQSQGRMIDEVLPLIK